MSLTSESMLRIVLYWIPAIFWMVAIFLLSNTPSSSIEETKEGPLAFLPPFIASVVTSSGFVHILEFGILAVLVHRLLASYKTIALRYVLTGSLLFTVVYGLLDEFHQSFVPGRDSSLMDLGFDTLGALIGVTIAESGGKLYRTFRLWLQTAYSLCP